MIVLLLQTYQANIKPTQQQRAAMKTVKERTEAHLIETHRKRIHPCSGHHSSGESVAKIYKSRHREGIGILFSPLVCDFFFSSPTHTLLTTPFEQACERQQPRNGSGAEGQCHVDLRCERIRTSAAFKLSCCLMSSGVVRLIFQRKNAIATIRH